MFEFSAEYNIIKDGDKYIKLSPKETRVLSVLLSKANQVCTYEAFQAKTEKEKSCLRTCINRLNRKLEKYIRISSVTNEGYYLVHVVRGR